MEPNQISPITQSIQDQVQPKVDLERVVGVLVKELETLKTTVDDIKKDKLIEALQIPEQELEEAGVIKPSHRLRTGNGWRPLLESEINEAQSKTENSTEAARYLGIAYRTYRKWCKFYGKWMINPWGKGSKKKYWDPNKGKYPLNQILEGKFPNYPVFRLKDLLIRSGVKEAKCEVCGFDERRFTDNKIPLLVNFRDGNEHNHLKENLQILCYNHYFLQGRGFIRRGKVEFNFLDPDRIQGSSRKIDARF